MKTIITFCLVLIGSMSFSQKAKSSSVNCKFHHIRYPEKVELSAKFWALSLTEQSACQGAIRYQKKQTPIVGVGKRSAFYINLIGSKGKFYYQAKERASNLDAKQTPYIHYELETRDITIISQVTKDKKPSAPEAQFNLIFQMRTPVILTATRMGDTNVVLLDTNNLTSTTYFFAFPQDAKLGTAADIKPSGYPTEAALLNAWRKYGATAEMQWRDRMISEFLRPVCIDFINGFIQFEEWKSVKIFSDKNKKGGYDHLVAAAEIFNNTMTEIDADYKAGGTDKFYTDEYQNRFMQCSQTWKTFLSNYNFDVSSKDRDVGDAYKQKILLNYINSLIFTKQFDEAEKQIAHYLRQEIRNVTNFDLKKLRRLNNQFQKEYLSNAERMAWN